MVIKPGSALGIVAIWLAAVAGVSATAWVAIDRAGRDITGASVSALPPAPLVTPTLDTAPKPTLTTPRPSVAPPPPPTAIPSPVATSPANPKPLTTTSPSASPRPARPWRPHRPATPAPTVAPVPQDKAISVNGGLVAVRCTGPAIQLRIAQPQNEWRVRFNTYGSRIIVSFTTGEEDSAQTTTVTAVCTNGAPVFKVSNG